MPFDVFISYSSKDKTAGDATCAALEAAGLRCWIAPRDVPPGSDWAGSIVDAIDHCRLMILVFSANANGSRQVHREVQRAFEREVPVVPFRIENIAPEKALAYYVGSVHWLDALTPPLEKHLERLVKASKGILEAGLVDPVVKEKAEAPPPPATPAPAAPPLLVVPPAPLPSARPPPAGEPPEPIVAASLVGIEPADPSEAIATPIAEKSVGTLAPEIVIAPQPKAFESTPSSGEQAKGVPPQRSILEQAPLLIGGALVIGAIAWGGVFWLRASSATPTLPTTASNCSDGRVLLHVREEGRKIVASVPNESVSVVYDQDLKKLECYAVFPSVGSQTGFTFKYEVKLDYAPAMIQ